MTSKKHNKQRNPQSPTDIHEVKELHGLQQASQYHSKVLKFHFRQEYFDVLTYAQKCSRVFTENNEVLKFNQLKDFNQQAFLIVLDCFKYSAFAYIQLQ